MNTTGGWGRTQTIIGSAAASLYALYYALTPTEWHFIDTVDLIFHEAGHTICIFFGEFIRIAMGSGFQILLPFVIALYFFYLQQRISGAVCLMWTGMNLIHVSIYAGDAIIMQLPLLGGDGVMHDWNYLLTTLNILKYTPQVAGTLYALGILTIGLGVALSFYFATSTMKHDVYFFEFLFLFIALVTLLLFTVDRSLRSKGYKGPTNEHFTGTVFLNIKDQPAPWKSPSVWRILRWALSREKNVWCHEQLPKPFLQHA